MVFFVAVTSEAPNRFPDAAQEPTRPAYRDLLSLGERTLTAVERAQIRFVRRTFERPWMSDLASAHQRILGASWVQLTTYNLTEVYGLDRFPRLTPSDSVILVSNHRSFFDMYVLSCMLIKRLHMKKRLVFPVRSKFFYDSPAGLLVNGVMSAFAMYPPIFRERSRAALNIASLDETIRLLRRLGCEVVVAKGQGCCGALTHHMGKADLAHAQAAASIRAFMAEKREGGLDAIVINTSGCGTTVKDYGHMFRNDPLAEAAATVAGLAKDISEALTQIGLPEGAPKGLRVAYHAACSLQHGQQIKSAPKDLLKRAGFEVVEPADSHLCCGSAGTYNLLQPEISADLKRRKVQTLEAKAPQVIAAGNIGCMMQIGSGTAIPVLHTVELLDWATGGPQPRALSGLGEAGPCATGPKSAKVPA